MTFTYDPTEEAIIRLRLTQERLQAALDELCRAIDRSTQVAIEALAILKQEEEKR